jgi:hypothetical protein
MALTTGHQRSVKSQLKTKLKKKKLHAPSVEFVLNVSSNALDYGLRIPIPLFPDREPQTSRTSRLLSEKEDTRTVYITHMLAFSGFFTTHFPLTQRQKRSHPRLNVTNIIDL